MSEDHKIREYKKEIDELSQCLHHYRRQVEEDNLKMGVMQQTIDQKERLYIHIKDQVDTMGKQLEQL